LKFTYMKKTVSFAFLLFIINALLAQEGAPLLTHFKESREIENQSWSICQDINHVMLFANRKGILSFDGQDWLSIRIPTIPFSMKVCPSGGKVFVGGDNNFGFLEKSQNGSYNFVSLCSDSAGIGIITRIVFDNSMVWFSGEKSVNRYNMETGKLDLSLKSKKNDPFTGQFVTPKNTFINVLNKGLYRLESDTLFPIVTGYLTEKTDILFSLPYNDNLVLVGQSDGKLLLFDGIKYYDYLIKDDGYIKDNMLSDGISLGDSLYAFSTLDGGALVIEKNSGKIRFTINNQNELPDDEIFAIGLDNSGGLWLSHQYGLTRADMNLPVGNFSIYPGLKGNLTTSLWHNNELYVATSEGVFYLSEVKNFTEVPVLIKTTSTVTESQKQVKNETPQESPRKGLLSRLFGKKVTQENPTPVISPTVTRVEQTRKIVSKLKSINYIFKKVEGFNEKCRQLVSTRYGILAASNKGLHVINDHRAMMVVDNRYVNFITWQPVDEKYYIAAGDGYFSVKFQDGKWMQEAPELPLNEPVYSIIKSKDKSIWLGVDNAALHLDPVTGNSSFVRVTIKNDFPQRYYLDQIDDSVFLYTESGIYFFDKATTAFILTRPDKSSAGSKMKYLYPLSNNPWVKHGTDWIYLRPHDRMTEKEMSLFKIFNDVISINSDNNFLWIVDGENRLFRIDLNKPTKINPEIDIFLKSIYDENGTIFNFSDIVFNRGDNIVNFEIVAPGYLKQNTTQYQYIVNKLMPEWSPWSLRTTYNLMIPVPGDYILQIRAKDLWGNIGEPKSIKFTIKAPFTETTIFFVLLISAILGLIFLFVRFREGQLQKENKILEEKVKERTAEIEAQKEEITSSIEYASRIQRAMLPEEIHFNSFFSDHFIIFKPRDIVSGDFYWIGEDDKHVFITVADCTGHGVPGAFMSALGISTLNEIITNNNDLNANTVLSLLRDKIKKSLHQTGKEGEAADGMDIAFCIIHKNKRTLEFSGAYNPLFIFQGEELKEYKADRMPIGIYYGEKNTFTNYEVNIKKGDTIYIFSDGFSDQFGGPDGVKFKVANLKRLLTEIYHKPMPEQRSIIENEFDKWKGSVDQVDDVTMIGVRI
jgi:serine phosphatase RsbU (regulator of sigma subunit)